MSRNFLTIFSVATAVILNDPIYAYTEVSSRIGFLAGLKAAANRLKKRGLYRLILPSFF